MVKLNVKMKIYIIFLLILITDTSSDENSDSLNLCEKATEADVEEYTNKTIQICGCKEGSRCIRKCCKPGYYHYHDENSTGYYESVCYKTVQINFSVPVYDWTTHILDETERFMIGMLSCNDSGPQMILQNITVSDTFYVQDDGSLYYPYYKSTYDTSSYCVDEFHGYAAHICLNNSKSTLTPEQQKALVHMTAKLIPLPFLVVTWLVYAVLPERNLHRYALMNHVFGLIPGNLLLGIGQFFSNPNYVLCSIQGYVILFFMVSSFFWMNVICIDIWLAFSNLKSSVKDEETKKKTITLSTVYSFGVPALEVLLVILLNTLVKVDNEEETEFYYPAIGKKSCFLYKLWPSTMYYFGPIVLLVIANIVLFVMTARNIIKTKKETSMVKNSQSTKKRDDKFKLYWKLLFVMGLNPVVNTHIVQLMAWAVDKDTSMAMYVYYFKDISHAIYGIVVFLVFVCQKNIMTSLKERYPCISKLERSIFPDVSAPTTKTTPTAASNTPVLISVSNTVPS